MSSKGTDPCSLESPVRVRGHETQERFCVKLRVVEKQEVTWTLKKGQWPHKPKQSFQGNLRILCWLSLTNCLPCPSWEAAVLCLGD